MITKSDLKRIMPQATASNINRFLDPLNQTMGKYEINTPIRIQSFLAQVAHESGQLYYVRELASGEAYEGRKDLGNIQPGDGVKFKGRGLIQITGRANYEALSKDLGVDFTSNPELLEGAVYAAESAGWFWKRNNLNAIAETDFKLLTKRINGGYNGLADRMEFFNNAKEVIA